MPSSEARPRGYRLIVQPQHHPDRSTPSPPSSASSAAAQRKRLRSLLASPKHDQEYLTTRKMEVKTKKNTEKRVQRSLVLDDGRVIAENAPDVVVDTVEDTRTHEEERLENVDGSGHAKQHHFHDAVVVPRMTTTQTTTTTLPRRRHGDRVVDDTFRRTVNTHDVKESATTTKAMGGSVVGVVKRRDFDRAMRDNRPLSEVVHFREEEAEGHDRGRQHHRHHHRRQHHQYHQHHHHEEDEEARRQSRRRAARKETQSQDRAKYMQQQQQLEAKPRVIHRSRSHKKIVDTEDVHNVRRRAADGKLYTETHRTEKHEVFRDKDTPDGASSSSGEERLVRDREAFRQVKKDEFTDYYRVPNDAAKTGGKAAKGQLLGRGARNTAEEREVEAARYDWDDLSDRIRRNKRMMRQKMGAAAAERMDALTKRPLNFHQEEKTRKSETDKWLERHFGSSSDDCWSSLADSSHSQRGGGGGGHNYYRQNFDKGGVRRSMSFSSIPISYHNPGGGGNGFLGRWTMANDEEEGRQQHVKTTRTKERTVKTTTTTYSPERTAQKFSAANRSALQQQQPTRFRRREPQPPPPPPLRSHAATAKQQQYRKYNSTLSLLPTPKMDYSLHGDSSMNGEDAAGRATRHMYGSTASLGRRGQLMRRASPPVQRPLLPPPPRSPSAKNNNNSYTVPIVEERYTNSSDSPATPAPVPPPRERRVYTTTQEQQSNRGFAYRTEESRNSKQQLQQEQTAVSRQPLYITELRREKLYPAASENNLLFDLHLHKSEEHREHHHQQQQQQQQQRGLPRNYLGFRSLERSDAMGTDDVDSFFRPSAAAAPAESSTSGGGGGGASTSRRRPKRKQQQARRRSQSFLVRPTQAPPVQRRAAVAGSTLAGGHHNHIADEDEYVYSREERRFVSSSAGGGLRHGHSDLRLDRGFKQQQQPHFAAQFEEADGGERQYGKQQQHIFSREIVRQQQQLEPQRFKTIIFLSGN